MLNRLSTLSLLLILTSLSYGAIQIHFEKIQGYDLTKPDTRLILPDTLREVSGLASINATTFDVYKTRMASSLFMMPLEMRLKNNTRSILMATMKG